jgi:hypothetical protein
MARSLLRYIAQSSSIIYTALHTPLHANSGYTSNSSTRHLTLSSLGLLWWVFLWGFSKVAIEPSLCFVSGAGKLLYFVLCPD